MTVPLVVIERDSLEKEPPGRVYVVGPLQGFPDLYAETTERHKATLFFPASADHLLKLGYWRGLNPTIRVEVD